MPRRRPGTLLPLELRILATGLTLQAAPDRADAGGFHGFLLASALQETDDAASLTAHGTLYQALGRMTERGLLTAAWEDPAIAAEAGRPRRRLYRVTAEGATALAEARAAEPAPPLSAARAARGLA
jgi:PadR family transcriptional regulator, regulatory protein PadR